MQFLRAYLIILNQRGKLNVTVHRDLNSLLETWKREKEIDQNCAALVHVGFDRPANEVIVELLADFPKRVLVTEAARWALPNDFQAHPISIGSCRCGADSVDMSVYIGVLKQRLHLKDILKVFFRKKIKMLQVKPLLFFCRLD